MGVRNPNSTNYIHPDEPNLLNLHKAMEYDAQGKPVVRVEVKGLSFDGNIDMSQVEITNDVGNPIPVSKDTNANASGNPIYVNVVNEVEIKNDVNNPLPISKNTALNSTLNPININNFLLDVSAGRVPGHSTVFLNGVNRSLGANVEETIWPASTLYPWSTWDADGAVTIHVGSSDAGDAGKTVMVNGLDANFALQTEVVTLPATNTVTTTKTFRRVNTLILTSDGTNLGIVTARYATAAGAVVAHMSIGKSISAGGYYTVPLGYTAFSVYGDFSCSKGEGAELAIYWRIGGTGPFLNIYATQIYASHAVASTPIPGAIPEKTDIDNRAGNSTKANVTITSNNQLLLINNAYL